MQIEPVAQTVQKVQQEKQDLLGEEAWVSPFPRSSNHAAAILEKRNAEESLRVDHGIRWREKLNQTDAMMKEAFRAVDEQEVAVLEKSRRAQSKSPRVRVSCEKERPRFHVRRWSSGKSCWGSVGFGCCRCLPSASPESGMLAS